MGKILDFTIGDLTWAQILHIFVRRARSVGPDGIGFIRSVWWEAEGVGWKGRRYSGLRGKCLLKLPAEEIEAPLGFCGLSPFALPRVLRAILRTGCNLTEVDLQTSHLQADVQRTGFEKEFPAIPLTTDIVDNRDARIREIEESDFGKRIEAHTRGKDCKQVLSAIKYGMRKPDGLPSFMTGFEEEQRAIDAFNAKTYAAEFAKVQEARNPRATLSYRVAERFERINLDYVEAAGRSRGLRVGAYEHDGISGDIAWAGVIESLRNGGLKVKEKPIPSTYEALLTMLNAERPGIEWPLEYNSPALVDISEIRDDPLARALYSLSTRYTDHEAFARVCMREMSSTPYAIEDNAKENLVIQWWDAAKCVWTRAGGGRRLQQHVVDICRKHVRPIDDEGNFKPAPSQYGHTGFFTPVASILKSYLPSAKELPALDGEQSRFLLRFACGNVLDLRTGDVRKAMPADRISFSTGYRYEAFAAASGVKQTIEHLVQGCVSFWLAGGTDISTDENLTQLFQDCLVVSPFLRLFHGLAEDMNVTLWLICQTTRSCGAIPGFEELLWFSASSGANGKGTWIALMMALLNTKSDGYFTSLDYAAHFMGSGMSGKNVNNPDMAACEGKRFCAVNEAVNGEQLPGKSFNASLAKRLASIDDPMRACAKYRDPQEWVPMFLLAFFANQSPTLPADDGGLASRLSYLYMQFTFVERPDPNDPSQKPIDTSVKQAALKGELTAEAIFWMAGRLTCYLGQQTASRQILPRPLQVAEDSMSHFSAGGGEASDIVAKFLEEKLEAWTPQHGAAPSDRPAVNAAFILYSRANGGERKPRESFAGKLLDSEGTTRFKARFAKKDYPVYKSRLLSGASSSAGPALQVVTLRTSLDIRKGDVNGHGDGEPI